MQINTAEIDFLVGDEKILKAMADVPALPMFSDKAMIFLAALSTELLHDKRSKSFVDVMSYAYWIRKASIEAVKNRHNGINERMGRGIAFHIAPSNVPVNFAVSMTSALLAGNASIIRVSNKNFEQVDIICDAIKKLLCSEYRNLESYFCIIRYAHSEDITAMLSSLCDIRIIWGGDNTISTIRKNQIPSRAIELTFADRYSIAIIDVDKYLATDPKIVAKGFYTDTYYSDQNACSSPRIVIWNSKDGTSLQKAKNLFWKELQLLVERDYEMKPIQAVDKYSSMCMAAMSGEEIQISSSSNVIMRINVKELTSTLMNYKNGGGYFFEYRLKKNAKNGGLKELLPLLGKRCQTVSVLGIEKEDVKRLVFENGVSGVDRIVDLGQTMGLEFVWDGYKMIEAMSRVVYFK